MLVRVVVASPGQQSHQEQQQRQHGAVAARGVRFVLQEDVEVEQRPQGPPGGVERHAVLHLPRGGTLAGKDTTGAHTAAAAAAATNGLNLRGRRGHRSPSKLFWDENLQFRFALMDNHLTQHTERPPDLPGSGSTLEILPI